MKVFGKETRESEHPIALEEVAVVLDVQELRELIRFLSFCEKGMNDNPDWEHVHLRDFLQLNGASSDIVIYASSKLSS